MQWFWDISAQVYFWSMAIPLGFRVAVHLICMYNLNTYRQLHASEALRISARNMHGWNALESAAMINMSAFFLPWMVSLCATDPIPGFLAHVPFIAAVWCKTGNSANHLKIQMAAIKALP